MSEYKFPHISGSGSLFIEWVAEGIGFGGCSIKLKKDGSVVVDDECMSKEFVMALVSALLDKSGRWSVPNAQKTEG